MPTKKLHASLSEPSRQQRSNFAGHNFKQLSSTWPLSPPLALALPKPSCSQVRLSKPRNETPSSSCSLLATTGRPSLPMLVSKGGPWWNKPKKLGAASWKIWIAVAVECTFKSNSSALHVTNSPPPLSGCEIQLIALPTSFRIRTKTLDWQPWKLRVANPPLRD